MIRGERGELIRALVLADAHGEVAVRKAPRGGRHLVERLGHLLGHHQREHQRQKQHRQRDGEEHPDERAPRAYDGGAVRAHEDIAHE